MPRKREIERKRKRLAKECQNIEKFFTSEPKYTKTEDSEQPQVKDLSNEEQESSNESKDNDFNEGIPFTEETKASGKYIL